MTLNKINLVGQIVDDPEKRNTSTGQTVVNFVLRVGAENPFDADEEFRVTAWNKIAEYVCNFSRGTTLLVGGRVRIESYIDSSGKQSYRAAINAFKVSFVLRSELDSSESSDTPFPESLAGEFEPSPESFRRDMEILDEEIHQLSEVSTFDDVIIGEEDDSYGLLTGDYSEVFDDSLISFTGDYSASEGLGGDEFDWESYDYE